MLFYVFYLKIINYCRAKNTVLRTNFLNHNQSKILKVCNWFIAGSNFKCENRMIKEVIFSALNSWKENQTHFLRYNSHNETCHFNINMFFLEVKPFGITYKPFH